MSFDLLLSHAAVIALAGAVCWMLLLLGCLLLEAASEGRLRPARLLGCPERWRVALVGAMLVALGAAPAHAEPVGTPLTRSLEGLPLPDRTVDAPRLRVPASRPPRSPATRYRVRAGDSLWRIARARLGPRASPLDVAAYVAAVHRVNRVRIGADPDLIHPGLELRLPSPHPRTR